MIIIKIMMSREVPIIQSNACQQNYASRSVDVASNAILCSTKHSFSTIIHIYFSYVVIVIVFDRTKCNALTMTRPAQWMTNLRYAYERSDKQSNPVEARTQLTRLQRRIPRDFKSNPNGYGGAVREELRSWCQKIAANPQRRRLCVRAKKAADILEGFEEFLILALKQPAYEFALGSYRSKDELDTSPVAMTLLMSHHNKTITALSRLIEDDKASLVARQIALTLITVRRPESFRDFETKLFSRDDVAEEFWSDHAALSRFVTEIGPKSLVKLLPHLSYGQPSNRSAGINRIFDCALLQQNSPYRLYQTFNQAGPQYCLVFENDIDENKSIDDVGHTVDQSPFYSISADAESARRVDNAIQLFTIATEHADKTGLFGNPEKSNVIPFPFGRSGNDEDDDEE